MPPRPLLVAALLGLTLAAGCQRISKADEEAALAAVRANTEAMNRADLEGATATIHPKSPSFERSRAQTATLFEQFRLSCVLEEAKVEKTGADGITIRFVLVTRKISGDEDFPDNRVTGQHLLKRDGEAWKIWSSQVLARETLENEAIPLR